MSQLLVNYLNDDPRPDLTEIEMKTFENVIEKTANLIYEMCCKRFKMCKHFLQLNCVNALLEASKKLTRGRHDESSLNACMNCGLKESSGIREIWKASFASKKSSSKAALKALKKLHEKEDIREQASMNQQSHINDNPNNDVSEINLI
ncbi:hypothetical protein HELRODRAFT_161116 [Helobdella robusta]|uniref:Uncharacterized protein n=1 Tax=Helobdella robusta TaxID=6412 RepID=T1ER40_HELRO|nr:hypothetical protein HELRODRAFT_161116 [Helobdella robusta]ESO01915.1 hypothetical protein HELRODRAFT_161116 [Helobdella robusta]